MQKTDKNRVEIFYKKVKSPIIKFIVVATILFILLELGSFAALKVYQSLDSRGNLDIYQNEAWSKEYFQEFHDSNKGEYTPYIDYRRAPNYQGKYINLDKNSIRKTIPNCSDASPNPVKIFVFGGSTIWGTGSRDEGTIPALISKNLCEKNIAVEVINFGESGYTNTHDMIRLLLELRQGNKPSIVIFYDGVNDVWSSYQNGIAGLPQNVYNRKSDFNTRNQIRLFNFIKYSNFMRVINEVLFLFDEKQLSVNEDLEKQTASIYYNNTKIINNIGKEEGFKTFFYWQPTIYTKKTLSEDEKNKINKNTVVGNMYIDVSEEIKNSNEIKDLSGIFNEYDETIFIDDVHISEKGNKIVADQISQDIVNYLNV